MLYRLRHSARGDRRQLAPLSSITLSFNWSDRQERLMSFERGERRYYAPMSLILFSGNCRDTLDRLGRFERGEKRDSVIVSPRSW